MLVAVLCEESPEDPGHFEVFGPFENEEQRDTWTKEVLAAAEAGYASLPPTLVVRLMKMDPPFQVQR